jgi:dienelactone hydrolase
VPKFTTFIIELNKILRGKKMKIRIFLTYAIFLMLVSFAFTMHHENKIHTEEIVYEVNGQKLVGLLAYDKSITNSRPGILVVHEWRGINDYAKKRAVDLAKEGYVAFALDMYGEGKEIAMSEARTMSRKIGTDYMLVKTRFNAALKILKKSKYVESSNIGAIGYCFGGGIVLNMARLGTEIDGVVGFHSSINTGLNAKKGDIKTKVLAIQGDMDPAAPYEKQQAFIKEMKDAEVDFSYIVYGNLPAHNFTNPGGRSYFEDEANMAWAAMLVFFDKIFE